MKKNIYQKLVKRIIDVFISLLGLLFMMPVLVLVAILVKRDSIGPLFYRGKRVGEKGRIFFIYKFRTMTIDAEQYGTTTALNDKRITRLGFALRKYKIDELPQLFNVLIGNMSLVGPRPEVSEHTSAYTVEELEILNVKPGITDYSSIHFASLAELLGEDDAHNTFILKYRSKKNELRLKYVKEQSFLVDIKIIIKTIFVILKKIQ